MKQVKLKSIQITDYKNIASLSKEVDGNHFIVLGKNGQGKTSIFELINRAALRIEPKDMADLPIKIGAKNAKTGIVILVEDNGTKREILVETIFRPSGTVMRVVDLANDGELKPPIDKLAQIIGVSHDLSPLMDMSGKEQFDYLVKVLGKEYSNEKLEEDYKTKYKERTAANKDISIYKTLIDQLDIDEDILKAADTGEYANKKEYSKAPDKSELLLEKQKIDSSNAYREKAVEGRDALQKQIDELTVRLKNANEWLDKNPQLPSEDVDAKLAEFASVEETYKKECQEIDTYNETVDKLNRYNTNKKELNKATDEQSKVQAEMDAITAKMKDAVKSIGVDKLAPELMLINELDDKGATKQGLYYKIAEEQFVPFNRRQISYGKMLVALAKLSANINVGKLNLFHIPAWESLDDDSRAEILKFAEDNEDLGLQFGIEEVKQELLGIRLIEKNGVTQTDREDTKKTASKTKKQTTKKED